MDEWEFVLHLTPFAYKMPRVTRYRTYNENSEVNKKLKTLLGSQRSTEFIEWLKNLAERAILVQLRFYFPLPKNATKNQKAEMNAGVLLHNKKPDIDNLAKQFLDIAKDVIINDDRHIAYLIASKHYSNEPRIEYTIKGSMYD